MQKTVMITALTTEQRPLLARFPALLDRFGPLSLAHLPTPVQRLKELEAQNGQSSLWVKRDDLSSQLYGGNKVRKLEFLLGPARKNGASTLLTMGGVGSNHLLATALHGASLGLRTVGVVFPQPMDPLVRRNQLADRGAGVELIASPTKYALPAWVASTWLRLKLREGAAPMLIPGGGSSPLGALGFVNAGMELADQVHAGELPEPRAIYVPYGTGGTAAGLAIGLQLSGLSSKVVAVRVIDRILANRPRLEIFCRSVWNLLSQMDPHLSPPGRMADRLEIRQGYMGTGYGHPTIAARAAVDRFAHQSQLALETTYTGKAAAAFLAEAASDRGPLLFWNTYSAADISRWVAAAQP